MIPINPVQKKKEPSQLLGTLGTIGGGIVSVIPGGQVAGPAIVAASRAGQAAINKDAAGAGVAAAQGLSGAGGAMQRRLEDSAIESNVNPSPAPKPAMQLESIESPVSANPAISNDTSFGRRFNAGMNDPSRVVNDAILATRELSPEDRMKYLPGLLNAHRALGSGGRY